MDKGCYVDGSAGHYGPAAAVLTMLQAGWQPGEDAALALVAEAYLAMGGPSVLQDHLPAGWAANAYDLLVDAADEAAEWGSANAPDGCWVGWQDGEYGCWESGF